jgi:uncharacterized protein (TIGR02285 family)
MKWVFSTLILFVVLLLIGGTTRATETITWFQPDFPPYVIIRSADKEQGVDNRIVQTAVNHLPDYRHQYKVANYARILTSLREGKPGIITPLFKTQQREQYVHYTDVASYLVFANGLIYRKADQERYRPFLLEDGSLDLLALCQSGAFQLGYASGRSYSGIIDEVILLRAKEPYMFSRPGANQLGTIQMVQSKRIDAAFGFPVEVKYAGMDKELQFFHISGMPPYIPVFFGAPKSQWGRLAINRLNAILAEKGMLELFAGYYRDWLDEELVPLYEQLRIAYYGGADGRRQSELLP